MTIITIRSAISGFWNREYGYRQLLVVAFPLILSTGSLTVQQFVDRMFLSWYSADTLAASMPAAMISFTIVSFFLGTSAYASTFIAQYTGANMPHKVGPAMWQGIYVSIIGGLIVASTLFLANPIFDIVGHDPAVRDLEVKYWKYLSIGGFFPISIAAVSSFFSGRGKTYPLMWASIIATGINIVLNYLLIFGNFGFPEMGISGAGLSTVLSQFFNFSILLFMALSAGNNSRFKTVTGCRFDRELFGKLIKYGLPSGVHFFLDIAAFSIFVLIIGRLGSVELAAANIALNASMISFMPMIGMSIAVSVLVGQALGSNRPFLASRATLSGLQIGFVYMGTIAILYLMLPNIFVYPFQVNADAMEFIKIRAHAIEAMKFVAAWAIFDTVVIIISSALKGAGDTKFIMFSIFGASVVCLILPTYAVVEIFDLGLKASWSAGILYILSLGIVLTLRYRTGKWQDMRVIEWK